MRIFDGKDPKKIIQIGAKESNPETMHLLAEGGYYAEIVNVNIVEGVKTPYGTKNALDVKFLIRTSVKNYNINKRLFVSEGPDSAFVQFLNAVFEKNVPDDLEIQDIIGIHLWFVVYHKRGKDGKMYADIEGYRTRQPSIYDQDYEEGY